MNRTKYYDVINVFACFSVVILHCNSYVHTFAHDKIWAHSLVFEILFYSAVPLFFMLSGATLFEYRTRYSTIEFYVKRFKKTVIPYLFFSSLFFWGPKLCGIILKHNVYEHLFCDFIKCLFTGSVPNTNYWFFIPLFTFYLFLPFLSYIVINCSEKEIILLLSIMFVFQSLGPLVNEFSGFIVLPSPVISGYCFYGILGFYLSKMDIKKINKLLYISLVFALFSYVIRYYLIFSAPSKNVLHFTYFGWYAVSPAIFIFVFFRKICEENSLIFLDKITVLAKYSFGVYLIHGFLISMLPFAQDSFSYRVIGIFLVYCLSIIITFIFKSIPIFNKLIP